MTTQTERVSDERLLRADLASLLERVKAATGPDRELDCLIEAIALCGYVSFSTYGNAVHVKRQDGTGSVVGFIDPGKHNRWFRPINGWDGSPTYTASADAALGLAEYLLPGRRTTMLINDDTMPLVTISATWVGQAPTLPLAILAALLSALTKEPSNV